MTWRFRPRSSRPSSTPRATRRDRRCSFGAAYERSLAGFDALGERGRPAEEVGAAAAEAFARFDAGGAAVDEHTADQLVLPLAVAGGEVAIPRVTDHVETNAGLIRAFGGDVRISGGDPPRIASTGGLGSR
jgi:RNA 3'-terminal phosphate cyclase (ATP)